MVLTAVALRAFAAHGVPQCFLEHRQMADVVAAQQVIRGVVRRSGPPWAAGCSWKRVLHRCRGSRPARPAPAAAEWPCPWCPWRGAQGYHRGRQGPDIPLCQALPQHWCLPQCPCFRSFVYDALILCLIFLHDALHIGMFGIGSIRKAELTVGGRLVHKGIQKFPQVFFRCIIQRGQDADGGQAAVCRRFVGHFSPLGFQHLFAGR